MSADPEYWLGGGPGIVQHDIVRDPYDRRKKPWVNPMLSAKRHSDRKIGSAWSADSRKDFKNAVLAFPFDELEPFAMVTLTYQDDWPRDGKVVQRHFDKLRTKFLYDFGYRPRGMWHLEWTVKGGRRAPHFHCAMEVPRLDPMYDPGLWSAYSRFEQWGFDAWTKIMSKTEYAFTGDARKQREQRTRFNVSPYTYVQLESRSEYFLRKCLGESEQDVVPPDFYNVGKRWGHMSTERRFRYQLCCLNGSKMAHRVVVRLDNDARVPYREHVGARERRRRAREQAMRVAGAASDRKIWTPIYSGPVSKGRRIGGRFARIGGGRSIIERVHLWSMMECGCVFDAGSGAA